MTMKVTRLTIVRGLIFPTSETMSYVS